MKDGKEATLAEKTKKQEKEKKKKLPFKRTVSNTVFALRQIWEASPVYFVGYYVMTFIYAPLDFLTGTYLIRMIVNGVEKNTPHEKIITYMLIVGAVQLTVNMISNYFWNVVNAGMYDVKIALPMIEFTRENSIYDMRNSVDA